MREQVDGLRDVKARRPCRRARLDWSRPRLLWAPGKVALAVDSTDRRHACARRWGPALPTSPQGSRTGCLGLSRPRRHLVRRKKSSGLKSRWRGGRHRSSDRRRTILRGWERAAV